MSQSRFVSSGTQIGIVGIVTSVGGMEAVDQVLAHLPADFPVPVLVLHHLPPGPSSLVELLSRRSPLAVRWAAQGDALEPATVLVSPPGSSLHVHPDGTVSLVAADQVAPRRGTASGWPSADQFLESIAFSYGPQALVMVLTGMGRYGARGVQEVKRQGGIVLAQDEESSARWDMPKAAIDTGCVDLILPPHEMASTLFGMVRQGTGLPRGPRETQASEALFAGGGATGALLHAVDWSKTPLGRVLGWGPALRAAVRIVLASPLPLAVLWGEDAILFYNDACSTLLGDAHPVALGRAVRDGWGDGADLLLPLIDEVRSTERAVERVDQPLPIRRAGAVVEEFATLAVSPLREEQGGIGGCLLTVQRTTDRHVSERRLRTLRDLGSAKAVASSARDACAAAARVLTNDPADLPFVLLYLFDADHQRAVLCGAAGLVVGEPASPHAVDLAHDREHGSLWPLAQVALTGTVVRVEHLRDRVSSLAAGTGSVPELCETAFLLPLHESPHAPPGGCAVLGTNSHYLLDPVYRDFLELVAKQIAQNMQAGQQLEEAQQRAEALAELDRVKTEFFSNISHEFRTPLTLLLSPLEDLLAGVHGDLAEAQHTALALAHRNSLRLLKHVNTLLDFSRIEAGRMRACIEPVDLATLTTDLVSGFRPAVERAGLQLVVDCPALPEPTPVDREMWEKIVLNLLSNALKFTFAGEITVRLRALPNHVELTVRDTGVGIAREHLPHLFTRFYRVPGSRGRTGEGSGIGLALVQELVRLQQGAVRAQSQPGRGSVFTVWLPRVRAPLQKGPVDQFDQVPPSTATGVTPFLEEASQWVGDDPDRAVRAERADMADNNDVLAAQRLPSVEPLSARSPGARVLVADDNADMRAYLHRLLSQYWDVETVADGEGALAALERRVPDLVLADVMMPQVDGFALLRAVRERPRIRTLPVILVTARAGEEAAIEGLLAGADDYITKPFSSRELVARVGAQLELARLRRESQAAIERSEAFQRTAVEASDVGVWELDLQTNQLSLSERAAALLGVVAGGDDTSAALAAHAHPEDRDRLVQAQTRALDPQGDGSYKVEYRVLHPDGRLLWLDSRGRTTFEESTAGERRPVVLRGALLDVSEQKRLLEVVRQAPNFVAVCGPDLTLDFVNEAGRQLIGQEGVDLSPISLVACFQSEEQQVLRDQVLPQVLREGQWSGELHLRHVGSGATLPVECRLYANYADDGRLVGVAVVASDISERKRAEAVRVHFRALFESAPGLYLVLEPQDFRIVAVSDAYLRATMTEREAIMGKTLFEVFPDDPAEPWADGVRNLRASLERVRAGARADVMAVQRYPVRRPADEGGTFEERWWSPINSPVFGPEGEIAYVIHRVEDVSPFIRHMQAQGREADGLHQLESRAQHMEAEIVLRAQELQQANEQLRASEERYRALLHATTQSARDPALHGRTPQGRTQSHRRARHT